MDTNGISLADIAAVSEKGEMDWTWLIALLIIGGIFNGGGLFGGGGNNAATQEILYGQQFQNLDNKLDRLGNGIADATFALNNSVGNVNYNLAQQSSAIMANDAANTQKILDALCQNKTQAMQNEINQLQLQAALANVPRVPVPSYPVPFPYSYGTQF